ncbi:MAG: heme-binding protein [Clostridia bacterium]|nr:heme-binding protein [Clostridia bacterium]
MDEKLISNIISSVISEINGKKLNLAAARDLIYKVEEQAKKIGVNAVVAVADAGANIIAVECMDDAYIASYDIAVNKAFTCAALKMPTSKLKKIAQPGQSLYGIQFTNGGKIVIFGGGVPLYYKGRIVGALGVSGGSEEQDTALAEYGGKIFEEEFLR